MGYNDGTDIEWVYNFYNKGIKCKKKIIIKKVSHIKNFNKIMNEIFLEMIVRKAINYNIWLKYLIVIGTTGTGKAAFVNRWTQNIFSD